METIFSLLSATPYIELPNTLLTWAGWVALLGLLLVGLRHWWEQRPERKPYFWPMLVILSIVSIITSLFFGVRLPDASALPVPGLPVEPSSPVVMFFSAIPWVLAGGFLGPAGAVLVGFFTGLLLGFWETHSLFTPLVVAGLALLFASSVRQRYRTGFYRFLRHPIGAALIVALAFLPVYWIAGFFEAEGPTAVRIDYALSQGILSVVVYGVAILVAGIVAEILYLTRLPTLNGAAWWGRRGILVPSPAESSLQIRFFYAVAPLVLVLIAALTIGDWVVAGGAARDLIENRMAGTATVAADSLPYFLETGQNLLGSLAEPELLELPPAVLDDELGEKLRVVPYFRLLYLFDRDGNPVSGYPFSALDQIRPAGEELAGVNLALAGIPMQTYTLQPWPGDNTAQVSFMAAIQDTSGQVVGVLLGRTDLESNPFSRPAVQALQSIQEIGGAGLILDENQRIIFYSDPQESAALTPRLVMSDYIGSLPQNDDFFQATSPTGARQYGYYSRVIGRPWSVIVTVPAEVAQKMALEIAVPLLAILVVLSLATFFLLRFALSSVTNSLSHLAEEATLIARGQLDHPLQVTGEDEIGSFARAFEQMRSSLKARLDDLNRLLLVSRGVAEHLNAGEAMLPVLQAALNEHAVSARVVLVEDTGSNHHNGDRPAAYGSGPGSERYAYLDGQVMEMVRQHNLVTIPNALRIRRLQVPPGAAQPGAIIAAALRDEHNFYGVLWLAYDDPYSFTDSEARFLNTLAGQAALAASNARLYASAEIGRQRLESVLASTPEPVLVIDEHMHLLLLNRAAMEVKGLVISAVPGKHIREVINQPDLLDMVLLPNDEGLTQRELRLDGRVYHASISPVLSEGRSLGKICILRDITQYKELDELKSDFVATVSHDLRSPLTLVRGYATMLQMVGDLNEQQKGYVRKIISGVENMTRLVNNLLDLGRIDAGIGLQIGPVRIFEVIERVVNQLQPQASQKKIHLMQDSGADRSLLENVTIQADAALLEQALYNLLDNAIKFTNVGGKVDIEVQLRPKMIVFEVRDTGIGVAPLDQPHMFEKFYRSGRREAYQQRGTGLGLAIVKTIAERHGGRVWVESVLGKGSSFYLEVPFKQARGERLK